MDDEEGNNRRHAEEMHDPGELVSTEEPSQLLQLHGLPDAQAGQDRDEDGRQHAPVEDLLHRVILAQPMIEPEAQGGEQVAREGAWADRQEVAAEMAGSDADDEIGKEI